MSQTTSEVRGENSTSKQHDESPNIDPEIAIVTEREASQQDVEEAIQSNLVHIKKSKVHLNGFQTPLSPL